MRYFFVIATLLFFQRGAIAQTAQWQAESIRLASLDVMTVPEPFRGNTRYVSFIEPEPKIRWRTYSAFAGLINALSLARRIESPVLLCLGIDRRGNQILVPRHWSEMQPDDWGAVVLARINLIDYKQTKEQWDKLGDPELNPHYRAWLYDTATKKWHKAHAPWLWEPLGVADPKPYQIALLGLLKEMAYPDCPVVLAQNFVWQTSVDELRPAGYHTWLKFNNQKDFEKLVRLDRTLTQLREVVPKSGIAREARALERWGIGDGVWVTYDQVNNRAIGRRNPVETTDPKQHKFDATEWIGGLPNGMRCTGLFAADGTRQDKAPPEVGYHHRSPTNDGNIHNYLTCWSCHDKEAGNGGLHPFAPYFRQVYTKPGPLEPAFNKNLVRPKFLYDFKDLYLTDLQQWADVDKRLYAAALYQANGQEPHNYATTLLSTYNMVDGSVDLERAALEYGVTPNFLVLQLNVAIQNKVTLDNTNSNWLLPRKIQTSFPRNTFNDSYNKGQLALRGLSAWPAALKTKAIAGYK